MCHNSIDVGQINEILTMKHDRYPIEYTHRPKRNFKFWLYPSKVTCRAAVGCHIGWQLLSQKLSTNGIECNHIQPFVLTNPNCYIKAVRIMA